MTIMNSKKLLALLIFTPIVHVISQAATGDREQEAIIDGGHWIENSDTGTHTFSQGFTLTQGTLHIQSDDAIVYQSDNGFNRIILTGNPATWQETLDDGSTLDAQANRIDYDLESEYVVMTQNVHINKGIQSITAEHVNYNVKTQKVEAGNKDGNSKIRMVIKPKKKSVP